VESLRCFFLSLVLWVVRERARERERKEANEESATARFKRAKELREGELRRRRVAAARGTEGGGGCKAREGEEERREGARREGKARYKNEGCERATVGAAKRLSRGTKADLDGVRLGRDTTRR